MNIRIPRAVRLPEMAEAPAFLRQDSAGFTMETEIAQLPRPVCSDPLSPAVADLMSKAILDCGEAYVRSVEEEIEKKDRAWTEFKAQVTSWAEGERQRYKDRAEQIAQAHHEMLQSREKFLALPRAPNTEAATDTAT